MATPKEQHDARRNARTIGHGRRGMPPADAMSSRPPVPPADVDARTVRAAPVDEDLRRVDGPSD